MGNGDMKQNENVYFRCRKEASKANERLCSREGAAELLGISVSTLADYELGVTKVVPVDKVVLMADLYCAPELKNGYCKHECPIGKHLPVATSTGTIEGIALRLISELDPDKLGAIKHDLIEIAKDGEVSEDNLPVLEQIDVSLASLSDVISEVRLFAEKTLGSVKRSK